MRKLIVIIISLITAVTALCFVGYRSGAKKMTAKANFGQMTATARNASDDEQDVEGSVEDLLGNLDLKGIQGLLETLTSEQLSIFGFSDISDRLRAIAEGKFENDFGGIVGYVFALLGADVFEFLPMLIACIAIVLAYNLINSVKGNFASDSIERVVYFATGTLAVSLVVGYFSTVLVYAVRFVTSIKTQINVVSPVLITLMTAAGASASAGVYTPTIAALGSGMTSVITYFAFPTLLMGLVFDIVGSVSSGIKLDKTAEFLRSVCKWFLGTAFFLFIAVIGVSGITASVRDGISVRAARFAVSKYVPVIGGYLSQGFDFVMAGNVLIKNALGSSAVVLIILCAAPVISKLAIFTLTLKLTAAIAEPLGGDRFCGILTSISKSSSMIAAVVIAMTFLYILFLSMIICTGNIGL
ncbi:MAG: stage III sporulation protein AE [Clostridiales bacterium]|nr:stage III sporulation protein AE [Clostridiales bacterium]